MSARRRSLLLCLLPCLLLCACRHNNELLENELRAKEALYREALGELHRIEAHNEALQREITGLYHAGVPPLPPEIAAPTFGLKRIALGRGTGGYDADGLPGDEALQVVVEPRDGDDHVVKVPGSLHVSAIEVNAQGLKQHLCWWTLTPEQLRPFWKQGLLSTGYAVTLPWTAFPHSETVRVVVQFKTADARVFEADRDVKVRLLPLSNMPMPTPVQPGPTPTFITPSGAVEENRALRWAPAPLTDAVDLGRPRPLSGPTAPIE
jgi:hypothetical protein